MWTSLRFQPFLGLACAFFLYTAPVAAADPPPFPPPLAKNAKPKPDEFPEERYEHELKALNVRATVLLGSRDYDGLEKIAAELLAQYQAKRIGGDEYIDRMGALAPSDSGKIMVPDTVAWVAARPKSYAARHALGRLYYDIGLHERGAPRNMTREQFEAGQKYARMSQAELRQSIRLTPFPLSSYRSLMQLAALIAESSGISTWPASMPQGRACPGRYAADGLYPTRWDEQIHYLCAALHDDPEAVMPFETMVNTNSPRWGGKYERLEELLEEFRADKRFSPKALGRMQAILLVSKAKDEFRAGRIAAASDLYVLAFHAAPEDSHVAWLYTAADYERNRTKNLERSRAIYSEIAAFRSGEADAIANVAFIDEERGDLRNYLPAMTAAANFGLKEAQNNLGYYYMVGQRGLPRDLQQARAWLALAANQGFEHARAKLGVVDGMIAAEKKGK